MAGPGNHDDLAVLLASFVEEVLPFCAGIRRGVTSIFAMQSDPQAIAAAHRSLDTIAAAATMFDVPAVRELSELAQLVDQAVAAAERGVAPDEARAPLLSLVNSLEAQLNGILADDRRGQERLANGRRLLDQVLELVAPAPLAAAAGAELPPFGINLDDLLLTLQPARPARPAAPPSDVLLPFTPPAPAPQPEPTVEPVAELPAMSDELAPAVHVLDANDRRGEDIVAEADDRGESAKAAEVIHDLHEADELISLEPVSGPLSAEPGDGVAPATSEPSGEFGWAALVEAAGEQPEAVVGEAVTDQLASQGEIIAGQQVEPPTVAAPADIDVPEPAAIEDVVPATMGEADAWREDWWLAEPAAPTPASTGEEAGEPSGPHGADHAVDAWLADPPVEVDAFADDVVVDVAPAASLAVEMAEDVPLGDGTSVPAPAVAGQDELEDYHVRLDGDPPASGEATPVETTAAIAADPVAAGETTPSAESGTDQLTGQVVAISDLLLVERPAVVPRSPVTGALRLPSLADLPDTADADNWAEVHDQAMAAPPAVLPAANAVESAGTGDADNYEDDAPYIDLLDEGLAEPHQGDATLVESPPADAVAALLATLPGGDEVSGAADDSEDDEPYVSVLDEVLGEPGRDDATFAGSPPADTAIDLAADDADTDFAALPDVSPELVAAFESLSEADLTTFLTLDGEAAMAFLESRVGEASATSPSGEDTVLAAGVGAAAAPSVGQGFSSLNLDPEILEVFLLELQELLAAWGAEQVKLRRAPADGAVLAELRRAAHTVKGAANMVGLAALGQLGRQVEQLLDAVGDRGLAAAPPVLDFVERSYAALQRLSVDATADPGAHRAELDALAATHAALMADLEGLAVLPAHDEEALPVAVVDSGDGLDSVVAVEPVELFAFESAGDDLVELFVQEAEEHLAGFNRALVALDRNPTDGAQLAEAKRLVHTLKGAAAALGYPVTAGLCHSVEDLFAALEASGREPSRELRTLFFESTEALERLVADIAAGRGEGPAPAERLRTRYAAHLPGGPVQPVATPDPLFPANPAPAALPEAVAAIAAATGAASEAARRTVRVDVAHLDALLNLVGELVINRTSQEQHLSHLARSASELRLSVDRLRRVGYQLESRYEVAELMRVSRHEQAPRQAALGRLAGAGDEEFDELELDRYTELHRISRELVEVAADVTAAQSELDLVYDGLGQSLTNQGRVSTELQDRLMDVRLVPISNIASRLYRAVRHVANRRRREVDFVLEGEGTQIDKVLLEEITDPLLHLVRNAADHGIEDPTTRRARGKPATGTVRLSASREGNEAVIRIGDDGAGIDVDAVLDKALARGLIRRRDELTREQALDLIFRPGFSTAAVSDISGRGVGLDVVRTNVTRLKGTIDVTSTPGAGTTFTIRLPILLAVTRALLVRVSGQTYAMPLPVVEQVAFYRPEQVRTIGGNELFDLGGRAYPVVWLARELGLASPGEAGVAPAGHGRARVLIVGGAERQVALVVDELVGQQEVVVKRLGRHLQSVAGVAGATILGNGQIVLILNVLDLVGAPRRAVHLAEAPPSTPAGLAAPGAPAPLALADRGERLALVVDDSLSVRRVLTRTLERDGWTVLQAKDGVEALDTLAWARPSVMLLDIEMPRMDGYELTGLVRGHPEHHDLPILMLTSRAGEKHRRKALDLGVSAYLVKPFDEAQLLRTVRELAAGREQQARVS